MVAKTKRTQAQIETEKRHDQKRKGADRLPGVRIDPEEAAVMNKLYGLFDSKKEAVLEAAKYYLKKHK